MYEPDLNDATDLQSLKEYVDLELQKISGALLVGETDSLESRIWTSLPPRPVDGLSAWLDSTISPIGVTGPHYYENGVWKFMGYAPVWHAPTSPVIGPGTTTSVIGDIVTLADGNVFVINEVVAAGFIGQFTFPNIDSEHIALASRAYYNGSTTHTTLLQIFNNSTTNWDTLARLNNSTIDNYRYIEIDNAAPYIDGSNNVLVRFFHSTPAANGHTLNADYLALQTWG